MVLQLTTEAQVQLFKDWDVNAKRDAEIVVLIAGVSKRFERAIHRGVGVETRTEDFDVDLGRRAFQLSAWPIDESVVTLQIFNDIDRAYGAATEILPADFAIYADAGQVVVDGVGVVCGARSVRIIYQGGLAKTTADLATDFPEISLAATRQVAFEYESRQRLGMRSQNLQSGDQVNYIEPGEWLFDMKKIIADLQPLGVL